MSHHTFRAWDYKVVSREEITDLSTLGAEGWEVVTDNKDPDTQFILKRPALSFQEQVTLDQRKRYFDEWDVDIDELDRKRNE